MRLAATQSPSTPCLERSICVLNAWRNKQNNSIRTRDLYTNALLTEVQRPDVRPKVDSARSPAKFDKRSATDSCPE